MIYLDNAATTGQKAVSVINAVQQSLINYNANPGRSGHDLSVKTAEEIYKCRNKIKNLFNASNENNVCFLSSCTHAINCVVWGVLKPNDHVIISSLEHNAVYRSVYNFSKQIGFEFDIAKVDLINDENTINNFKNKIKSNTKLIIITAASNVIGRKLPLKRIGEICKNNGILFCVDAAQLAGKNEINIKKNNIDFLCVAPHKGFYSPAGVGVLIAEKSIDKPLIYGGTGVNSVDVNQPKDLPEKIESGTLNIPGIMGLSAGVDFIKSKGIKRIEKHEISLVKFLYINLKKIGAQLYTVFPDENIFAPVLSFNVKGYSSEKIGEYLNQHGIAVRSGLHCSPLAHKQIGTIDIGTVRISPSIFNNRNDIEKLIFYTKKII